MRVFISADIEGVAGITDWEEGQRRSPAYGEFRRQMTAEVSAACEGALAAGAEAITVKDAHGSARNLTGADLPPPTRLVRGWSGHPFGMVQNLDKAYDAALFVGYHARAGAGGNPLAHTMSSARIHEIRLNGEPASEYRIHAYAASMVGVPVALVTGDATLCEEVSALQPNTRTVATKWGEGPSQESLHPQESVKEIRSASEAALSGNPKDALLALPDAFELEICYKQHTNAYAKSFYPGASQIDPHTLRLESADYFEILRALMFLV